MTVDVSYSSATRGSRDPEMSWRMMLNFLTNLGHELRTPLVTIRGYTRLVMEGGAGELNEAQRSHLQQVFREANEMVTATDALTSVSRFEAFRPAALNVRNLLMESVRSAETSLPGRRLVLGPEPAAPILLVGDRDELNRAIEAILRVIAASTEAREAIHIDFESANRGKRFSIRIHQGDASAAGSGVQTAEVPAPPGAALSAARDLIRLHGGRLLWRGSPLEALVSLPSSPQATSA
jgi:signal transduction histidine kinase